MASSARRVQLTALSDHTLPPPLPPSVLNSDAVQNSTTQLDLFASLESLEPDAVASVRMELVLFEPDDLGCAEFYYPELLDMKVTGKNRVDTFGDVAKKKENEEMVYVAKMFEEKYGRASKKRKDRPQDLVDIGDGYDDSDSFIDNSEAYDELVPACLTTKHGGFYINFGALQFRQALGDCAGNETDDFEDKVIPKKRKRHDDGKLKKVNKKKKRKKEEQSEKNYVKKSKSQRVKKTPDINSMLKEFHKEKLEQLQVFNLNGQQAIDCGVTSQLEESGSANLLNHTAAEDDHLQSMEHECDVEEILSDHKESGSPEVVDVTPLVKPSSLSTDGLPDRLVQHVQQFTEDDPMKDLIQRLDEAVSRVMPEQMDRFKHHCQTRSEAIALRREAEKEQALLDGSDNEKGEKSGKRVFGPRKWFRWTDEIKEMLCEVVQLKISSYELEAPDKQNLEDYLKNFLETHVKPLWPRGWMQSRILLIESRKVHHHITGITAKRKSLMPASKKVQGSTVSVQSVPALAGTSGVTLLPELQQSFGIVDVSSIRGSDVFQVKVATTDDVPGISTCASLSPYFAQTVSSSEVASVPKQQTSAKEKTKKKLQFNQLSTIKEDSGVLPNMAVTEGSCGDPALPTPSLSLQASAHDFNIKLQVLTDMTPLHALPFPQQQQCGKNFQPNSITAATFQEGL